MHRRTFLACVAAGVFSGRQSLSSVAEAAPVQSPPAEVIPLWAGIPPGGGGPGGPVKVSGDGALSHIARPALSVYLPANPNGYAVLIAAGVVING